MKKLLFLLLPMLMVACGEDVIIDPIPSQNKVITSNITTNTTWYSDTIYQLAGRIAVEAGATLTIEPGTIIKGEAGTGANATALLIARGANIVAQGTPSQPIIFTSVADEISQADVAAGNFASPNLDPTINGLWGGVIILGNAKISPKPDAAGEVTAVQIEGIPTSDPNGLYGGNDDNDNSGVFSFVSIRHGGANIGSGNEINGLTLGGVGSLTTINNIEIGRTTAGNIGYIGHIPAKTMRVRRLRDGFIQLLYGKAVYFRNFGDQETPNPIADGTDRPNEIIHLKKYTPMNNYYGLPDIVAAQTSMAGNEFAGKYNLDYFENKAVPRYVITVKGAKLSPESERKLLEFFQVGLKGKNHRSLYVPLPPDSPDSKVEFKMEPIEASSQESSFNVYRKANRDEILLAHRVPINKIGVPEGISLASARDADKMFKEQVCRPAQDILEKKLNRIISEKTDALILKFNELTLTDEDTQSKIDERYLRMQVITPNEVRIRKGMVPRDGGDNVVDLKAQGAAEQTAQAMNSRNRTQERSANSPDISGEARNPKGEGRVTA